MSDLRGLETPRSEAMALRGLERISQNPGTFLWLYKAKPKVRTMI